MEQIDRRHLLAGAGIAGAAAFTKLAHAGPLNPPAGAVAASGKTNQEIFDRLVQTGLAVPLDSLPAGPGGGVTINSKGSYYLSRNLVPTSGPAITVNADCQIDLNGFMIDASATNSAIVAGPGGPRVSVFNGRVMGSSTPGAGTAPMMDFRTASQVRLVDVDSSTAAVPQVYCYDLTARNCTFDGSGTGADQVQCQSGKFENCTFSNSSGRAIAQALLPAFASGNNRVQIINCQFISPAGHAVELLTPGIVSGCTFGKRTASGNTPAGSAIVLNGGGLVDSCVIDQFGQYGVIGMGSMPTITNNRIFGCNLGGILLRDSATIGTGGGLVQNNTVGGSFLTNGVGIKVAAPVQANGNAGHLIIGNYCVQNWRNVEISAGFNFALSNRLAFQFGGGHTSFAANVTYGPVVAGTGDLSSIANSIQFGTNLTF